jgi:hypothetical protein
MNYRHTQFGALVVMMISAVMLFEIVLAFFIGPHPLVLGFLAVMTLVLTAFHSLTVDVDRERIRVRFGWSPFGRTDRAGEVRDAREVRNRWYYGWGIRLTPHGWLYNVSGLDAVEVEFESGKKVRIGTDEPRELLRAIRQAAELSP